jgi:sulfofructose kinase
VTKSPQVDVVGVGLNATDTLIYLPEFPAPGSKIGFRAASVLPGGQVATALLACQSWGMRTRYVGSDTAAAITAASWARAAGIPTVADLDEVYPGVDALLDLIDYLIVSREFPSRLLSQKDLRKSLPLLQRRFGSTVTAATLGSGGVLAWDGKQFHSVCAYRVPVVDTTGAGDIFHAGFIYGLIRRWPLRRQLEFACAAAALNCMASGARGGVRSIMEIERLMLDGPRYPAAFDISQA